MTHIITTLFSGSRVLVWSGRGCLTSAARYRGVKTGALSDVEFGELLGTGGVYTDRIPEVFVVKPTPADINTQTLYSFTHTGVVMHTDLNLHANVRAMKQTPGRYQKKSNQMNVIWLQLNITCRLTEMWNLLEAQRKALCDFTSVRPSKMQTQHALLTLP